MVENVQIDTKVYNEPVSVSLQSGESITVPSGEVWKVVINCAAQQNDRGDVRVNGAGFAGLSTVDSGNPTHSHGSGETVLVPGDEVSTHSNGECHIGGFIVRDDY